jgi:hypothetical protein
VSIDLGIPLNQPYNVFLAPFSLLVLIDSVCGLLRARFRSECASGDGRMQCSLVKLLRKFGKKRTKGQRYARNEMDVCFDQSPAQRLYALIGRVLRMSDLCKVHESESGSRDATVGALVDCSPNCDVAFELTMHTT